MHTLRNVTPNDSTLKENDLFTSLYFLKEKGGCLCIRPVAFSTQ